MKRHSDCLETEGETKWRQNWRNQNEDALRKRAKEIGVDFEIGGYRNHSASERDDTMQRIGILTDYLAHQVRRVAALGVAELADLPSPEPVAASLFPGRDHVEPHVLDRVLATLHALELKAGQGRVLTRLTQARTEKRSTPKREEPCALTLRKCSWETLPNPPAGSTVRSPVASAVAKSSNLIILSWEAFFSIFGAFLRAGRSPGRGGERRAVRREAGAAARGGRGWVLCSRRETEPLASDLSGFSV